MPVDTRRADRDAIVGDAQSCQMRQDVRLCLTYLSLISVTFICEPVSSDNPGDQEV